MDYECESQALFVTVQPKYVRVFRNLRSVMEANIMGLQVV